MNNDRPLQDLLRSWQPQAPDVSSSFQDQVWQRIHRQGAAPGGMLLLFPTTLRAAACWAAAIAAFGGSAAAYAYDSLTRDQRMAAAHAAAIDPIQISAAPNTVHRH